MTSADWAAEMRPRRIKDEVSLVDHYGRVLFKVDRWIYEVALERGDLARWFGGSDDKR